MCANESALTNEMEHLNRCYGGASLQTNIVPITRQRTTRSSRLGGCDAQIMEDGETRVEHYTTYTIYYSWDA